MWPLDDLIVVSSQDSYTPTSYDVGSKLLIECKDGEDVMTMITDTVIIAPPTPKRELISIAAFEGSFRILSYNILADHLAFKSPPKHCPTWALLWVYRRRKLLEEIKHYNVDIICLQEVQDDHFETFFKPQLEVLGYFAIYKKQVAKGSRNGCATFFLTEKFTLIEKEELEFHTLALAEMACNEETDSLKKQDMMKDNVAIIVILVSKKDKAKFCVANTHIHFDKKHDTTKVWQVATLTNKLEDICRTEIPVLLCGDLNSTPRSDAYNLVVEGFLQNEINSMPIFTSKKLHHCLDLASAYWSLDAIEGQRDKLDKWLEPSITFHSSRFQSTIDYIFYSAKAFKVTKLLELVDVDEAIPSPILPSDHIALMAEFSMDLESG